MSDIEIEYPAELPETRSERAYLHLVPDIESRAPKVMLVGPSQRFLSGISAYTFALGTAMANETDLSVMLMRRLLPQFLYPGAKRVGQPLSSATLPDAPVLDGVDYYWFPSILRAARFMRAQRPEVVILEWWSGTVLHTYLALSRLARSLGAQVIVEFHETLDPGEQGHKWFSSYVRRLSPRLFATASSYVVHSERERADVIDHYALPAEQVSVVPHGAYVQYCNGGVRRLAPDGVCNLLFFGLIRPVKGLEDLIDAFGRIPADEIDGYWLTIVGEIWEEWTLPLERIEANPYRDRISVVNRYVSDAEVDEYFGGADAVVLPYRRAAQSGVLHVAMAYGLPVVASNVGGLGEALRDYPPHLLVEAGDADGLLAAVRAVRELEPTSRAGGPQWKDSARLLRSLCDRLLADSSEDGKVVRA